MRSPDVSFSLMQSLVAVCFGVQAEGMLRLLTAVFSFSFGGIFKVLKFTDPPPHDAVRHRYRSSVISSFSVALKRETLPKRTGPRLSENPGMKLENGGLELISHRRTRFN